MSRCIHYVSLNSIKQILRDPAHGVALAYTNSPRTTFGELSCHHFTTGEKRRTGPFVPGQFDTCAARFYPDSVDLLN